MATQEKISLRKVTNNLGIKIYEAFISGRRVQFRGSTVRGRPDWCSVLMPNVLPDGKEILISNGNGTRASAVAAMRRYLEDLENQNAKS